MKLFFCGKLKVWLYFLIITLLRRGHAIDADYVIPVDSTSTPLCLLGRFANYEIDEISMPKFMAFCTCVFISPSIVLTNKECFAQKKWFVINAPYFETAITKGYFQVEKQTNLIDKVLKISVFEDILVIETNGTSHEGPFAKTPKARSTKQPQNCFLFSFSPPTSNKNITSVSFMWLISSNCTIVPVTIKKNCRTRHSVNRQKDVEDGSMNITEQLCFTGTMINKMENNIKVHSFDQGAPIICHESNTFKDPLVVGMLISLQSNYHYISSSQQNEFYAVNLMDELKFKFVAQKLIIPKKRFAPGRSIKSLATTIQFDRVLYYHLFFQLMLILELFNCAKYIFNI